MTTRFALVDCSSFYASCERVFRPELEGKPVVVLSNNDGCIIARSNEAKNLGIKMGAPYFQLRDFMEKQGVAVFSSNYELYGDMSRRVTNVLLQFTPNLEVYSIDESFMDFSHLKEEDVISHSKQLRERVLQWTGIPVSVGVGPTKTLAKVANRLAKKKAADEGVMVLTNTSDIEAALEQTEVRDVWGIGRQHAARLQAIGVGNARQFRDLPADWVKKNMAVTGLRTVLELRGSSCINLEADEVPAKKNICTSRSFGQPISTLSEIEEALSTHTVRCSTKLRRQESYAGAITVFLLTNRFAKDASSDYYSSKSARLPAASNSETQLLRYANALLKQMFRKGERYVKVGVVLSELVPAEQVQLDIFSVENTEKQDKLMMTLDNLRQRFGHAAVKYAVQGEEKNSKWAMKHEHLSQCYTTRFEQLLRAR
ncbi:Y-family DNA polymerase [Pontibacter harenae]|uniref:Y-family DNA polymerase n=1 Tax=Pontibacter harenae TaxID=2894083 RepID=UPI001E40B4AB|nr:Y-family DNA polymerase [Pontibacter harenae]MCC9165552.1 Y-family DNA polymerase [Pontibacter harenae]